MNVPNFSQPGLTRDTSIVPTMTPGARPMTIGSTRRHTTRQRVAVHPQHVRVQHDFDRDQRRVQDAVGQEEQRQRNRQRRKAIPQRAVDDGGAEGDARKIIPHRRCIGITFYRSVHRKK